MDSEDHMIPNHNDDDYPGFEPLYYEGEEFERGQLDFLREPVETAIDGYFDYKTPIIVKREIEQKRNAEKAKDAHDKLVRYSKQAVQDQKQIKNKLKDARKAQSSNRKESGGKQDVGGGWSTDTRTKGVFDSIKKNEIFNYQRGAPESQTQPLAEKVIKKLQAQESTTNEPPLTYADVAEIEKQLSKENANTIKSIIKTNEAKLKLLEDQLKKEEKKSEEKNKAFMQQIKTMVGDQQKSDEYIKAMKAKNEELMKRQGFQPTSTSAKALKNQKKSDIHPIAAPKVKSSNYGGAGQKMKTREAIANNRLKPVVEFRKMPGHEIDINDPMGRFENDELRGTGVTWADQIEMLKEGYQAQLKQRPKEPTAMTHEGYSTPERGTYASLYQMAAPGTYMNDTMRTDELGGTFGGKSRATSLGRTIEKPTRPLSRGKKTVDGNIRMLQQFAPTHLTPQAAGQHGQDLRRLEDQLASIRGELQPIMKELGRWPRPQGPTAELMSASVGRLIKIHSDKLTNMLVDDLLIEIVAVLNAKEEIEKRMSREQDVRAMALALCEELNKIDVDQRFLFEASKSNALPASKKLVPIQPSVDYNFAFQFLHGNKDQGKEFLTNNGLGHKNRDFDSGDIQRFKAASMFAGKGPYKGIFSDQTKVTLQHSTLVKLLRDQIMNEDNLQKVPYLRRQNAEALAIESDKLIEEALGQVLKEFEEAQEEFVKSVVKGEFE